MGEVTLSTSNAVGGSGMAIEGRVGRATASVGPTFLEGELSDSSDAIEAASSSSSESAMLNDGELTCSSREWPTGEVGMERFRMPLGGGGVGLGSGGEEAGSRS